VNLFARGVRPVPASEVERQTEANGPGSTWESPGRSTERPGGGRPRRLPQRLSGDPCVEACGEFEGPAAKRGAPGEAVIASPGKGG